MILNQNKMRLRTLILVAFVSIVSACAEKPFEVEQPQETGTLSIQIEPEIRVDNATKAVSGSPDVNEFKVEIYKYANQGLLRLYRDSYENTVGKTISLNAADYMVHARHGDSLGVGFNAIYYAAQANLTVQPHTNEVVRLEAKMANAKVAVVYGDDLKYDWPEYYAKVKCTTKGGRKRSLQFSQNETRAGYMPAGQFVVELYIKVGEDWMYYHTPEMAVQPNDFITFNVDTEKADGSVTLSATIDNGVEVVEKNVEVSSGWLPKDAPVINTVDNVGNDFSNKTYSLIEAANSNLSGLKANIVAPGLINHCYLEVTSDYLRAQGVPEEVDLAADLDPSVEEVLKAVGLKWMTKSGQRLGYVDFTGIANWIEQQVCDPSNLFSATFSLRVEDQRQAMGEAQTEPITFEQGNPEFELYDIPTYNCWAKRIDNVSTYITSGNPDALSVEYKKASAGDDAWAMCVAGAGSETNVMIYDVAGLEPSTEYMFRARYNGNPLTQVVKTATTEAALQIDNSDFETWATEKYAYQYYEKSWLSGSWKNATRNWFLPFSSGSKWWDVNSAVTMPKKQATPEYQTYKVFPCVSYSTDTPSGNGKSAQVACIYVCNYATSSTLGDDLLGGAGSLIYGVSVWSIKAAGEIFIGSADESGNHLTEGHEFSSRPNKIRFQYKYVPYGDETFQVTAWIKGTSGEKIAVAETKSGSSSSDWASYDLNFNYTKLNEKAAQIYVMFRASSKANPEIGIKTGSSIEMAGTSEGCHMGSLLKVDNLELIYE